MYADTKFVNIIAVAITEYFIFDLLYKIIIEIDINLTNFITTPGFWGFGIVLGF